MSVLLLETTQHMCPRNTDTLLGHGAMWIIQCGSVCAPVRERERERAPERKKRGKKRKRVFLQFLFKNVKKKWKKRLLLK